MLQLTFKTRLILHEEESILVYAEPTKSSDTYGGDLRLMAGKVTPLFGPLSRLIPGTEFMLSINDGVESSDTLPESER